MLAEKTESVSVIDHYAEIVFLLESCNLVELAESTGHSVNALGDEKHSASVGISLGTCFRKHLLAVCNIVVTIFVFASEMETDTVQETCMALGIINDDIVT